MRPWAAYLAATLAATPLSAQEVQTAPDWGVFDVCIAGGIGGGACPSAKLAKNLGLLDVTDVKAFSPFGVESFAMLTSLRYGASALFFLDEGEPCIAEEERTAAVEVWSLWVEKPANLPQDLAERFDLFDALIGRMEALEVIC